MNTFSRLSKGYLLFELMISLMVLILLMQFLLPTLNQLRTQTSKNQQLLERVALKMAVIEHFQSQFAPIFWQACGEGQASSIELGPQSANLPERIAHKSLLAQSDWLQAKQHGLCSYPIKVNGLTETIAYSCSWDVGDEVIFSSCMGESSGRLISVSDQESQIRFDDASLLGQTGVILSQDEYFWYLAPGKNANAFWRTPSLSGNSLELWSGISQMALYPLLDEDGDGAFDSLSSVYGEYPATKLTGFWVELVIEQGPCDTNNSVISQYQNHRGEVWQYDSRCAFPLQFVVAG